jgi:hypothetical protein
MNTFRRWNHEDASLRGSDAWSFGSIHLPIDNGPAVYFSFTGWKPSEYCKNAWFHDYPTGTFGYEHSSFNGSVSIQKQRCFFIMV